MRKLATHFFLIHANLAALFSLAALAQDPAESPPSLQPGPFVSSLPLAEPARATLLGAIGHRQYHAAEELLAEEAKKNPESQALLLALANVLFLDGKQLNSIVVLKKAELLGPLDERNRFLLALSYIAIGRKSLASQELESLQQSYPANAVYPYWLSRLAYRQLDLQRAVTNAQTAVRLDPKFMKAYDQLGLCYAGLNQNDEAVLAFTEAIRLNGAQALHSPWPSMNLGTLFMRLERLDEAESHLRDSLSIDSRFPTAHLRLGQVLEKEERLDDAVAELGEAARLDPTYPEPHYALARIYRKRHKQEKAETESQLFQELRNADKAKGITRPD